MTAREDSGLHAWFNFPGLLKLWSRLLLRIYIFPPLPWCNSAFLKPPASDSSPTSLTTYRRTSYPRHSCLIKTIISWFSNRPPTTCLPLTNGTPTHHLLTSYGRYLPTYRPITSLSTSYYSDAFHIEVVLYSGTLHIEVVCSLQSPHQPSRHIYLFLSSRIPHHHRHHAFQSFPLAVPHRPHDSPSHQAAAPGCRHGQHVHQLQEGQDQVRTSSAGWQLQQLPEKEQELRRGSNRRPHEHGGRAEVNCQEGRLGERLESVHDHLW